MAENEDLKTTYTIGAVAKMTGITTYTLRMWERRYQTVVARRHANGRRYYSRPDIERLSLLKILTDQGTPISTISSLSIDQLKARREQALSISRDQLPDEVRVAVFGTSLLALIDSQESDIERINVIARGSDMDQFHADTRQSSPDVLVIEVSVLNESSVAEIQALQHHSRARKTIVVYQFGRRQDVERFAIERVQVLRNPVTIDELTIAILNSASLPKITRKGSDADGGSRESCAETVSLEPIAPRRFSMGQLASLDSAGSSIDCECPRHMSVVLSSLGAFEVYSQECEDRDDKDAMLHAFLHAETARARAIMENALERLLEIENITIK